MTSFTSQPTQPTTQRTSAGRHQDVRMGLLPCLCPTPTLNLLPAPTPTLCLLSRRRYTRYTRTGSKLRLKQSHLC